LYYNALKDVGKTFSDGNYTYSGFLSRASFADLSRVCWFRSRHVVCITSTGNNKWQWC